MPRWARIVGDRPSLDPACRCAYSSHQGDFLFSPTPSHADPLDMLEYVSEALSLFAESYETKKKRGSDKSNLAGISGDHEDANVIALRISGKHKEADSLRVIFLWSPDNLF